MRELKLEDMYFPMGDYTIDQIVDAFITCCFFGDDAKVWLIHWYNENVPHARKRVSTNVNGDISIGVSKAINEDGFLGFPVGMLEYIK
jgi:hypothetical protein